jgi:hypothetical protein
MSAPMARVKPRFHPEGVVTCVQSAIETIVTASIAKKVYCIIRFFVIVPCMCGAGFTTSSFEVSLLMLFLPSQMRGISSAGLLNFLGNMPFEVKQPV